MRTTSRYEDASSKANRCSRRESRSCRTFESLRNRHRGPTLAIDTIETAAAMFAETGRPFPLPVRPQDQYSGRVTLRLPKSLHRALANAAEEEGVSLNQHLVTALVRHTRGLPAQGPDRPTRI